jgi:glycosyltransferase involved in cell wall biosynthesis
VRIKVGLVGYACATGLGNATLDFYRNLPFERFLVIPHAQLAWGDSALDSRCHFCPLTATERDLKQWMHGLDGVFSIEHSYIARLWPLAKRMGIRVTLMPNAEWLDPGNSYLDLVDTFIAPTRACYRLLKQLGWERRSVYIPHPVDTERFAFRERRVARIFLHCRGWGGYRERKGTDIVYQTAELCRNASFVVRAQSLPRAQVPPNLALVGASPSPEELYEVGDVAIQPSRWEGVGLQILEAMACGIPVIVPNEPPMNEYPADSFLRVPAVQSTVMLGERLWPAYATDVTSLANLVCNLNGRDISTFSRRCRAKMEWRSWSRLRPRLASTLKMA